MCQRKVAPRPLEKPTGEITGARGGTRAGMYLPFRPFIIPSDIKLPRPPPPPKIPAVWDIESQSVSLRAQVKIASESLFWLIGSEASPTRSEINCATVNSPLGKCNRYHSVFKSHYTQQGGKIKLKKHRRKGRCFLCSKGRINSRPNLRKESQAGVRHCQCLRRLRCRSGHYLRFCVWCVAPNWRGLF